MHKKLLFSRSHVRLVYRTVITMNNKHFPDRRWGVFNHFIYTAQNMPDSVVNQGKGLQDWNTLVNGFDAERVAYDLNKIGAEYYFITLMQGTEFMIAPNKTFDNIAGTKPGEACSFRDLPMDLYHALSKYNIDLCLYFTGDGPYKNTQIGEKFGMVDGNRIATEQFVEKWSAVLEEYAVRYGERVHGWWIDGCYKDLFGYTNELLELYYRACKKGNPGCVVSMNDGVKPALEKYYEHEDYVTGEFNDFYVLPKTEYIDGARPHILAPLGIPEDNIEWPGWCKTGLKRDAAYMADYVRLAGRSNMPVTIDIALFADSTFDSEQLAALEYISKNI